MEISFKFKFIRDYFKNRRDIFSEVYSSIGDLEVLLKRNGLGEDRSRAFFKSVLYKGKSVSCKTKSQRKACNRLKLLINKAIELYEKKKDDFLSKV